MSLPVKQQEQGAPELSLSVQAELAARTLRQLDALNAGEQTWGVERLQTDDLADKLETSLDAPGPVARLRMATLFELRGTPGYSSYDPCLAGKLGASLLRENAYDDVADFVLEGIPSLDYRDVCWSGDDEQMIIDLYLEASPQVSPLAAAFFFHRSLETEHAVGEAMLLVRGTADLRLRRAAELQYVSWLSDGGGSKVHFFEGVERGDLIRAAVLACARTHVRLPNSLVVCTDSGTLISPDRPELEACLNTNEGTPLGSESVCHTIGVSYGGSACE